MHFVQDQWEVNMATPNIVRGSDHFSTVIYEGNGTGQRVGNFVPFTDNGTIAKSCIFEDGDSPYLRRTPSGAGNRDTYTLSFWIKRGNLGALQMIIAQGADHNNSTGISFNTSNQLRYQHADSGSATDELVSNRTFEDTSKWYHIVLRVDTTQSTEANRVRMYVDGDEITSWATANYPSQNTDTDFNSTGTIAISGQLPAGTLFPYDGYIAEINMADGQSYGPDTFGLTDTSTGRWIPKSLTGITYGTNGFRLQFGTSSALGDDTSGNGNDFGTVNGLAATDQTIDSPTQNFNNMGGDKDSGGSASEGNLKAVTPSSGGGYNQIVALPSFGVSKGKWYWEARITDNNSCILGWKDDGNNGGSQASTAGGSPGNISGICCGSSGSFSDGELSIDTGYSGPDLGTTNNNDIFMFALDLDNQRAFIGQNGSWLNSDNPATPTDGVGGLSRIGNGLNVYPAMARLDNSATAVYNFGQNPSFSGGITAAANTASSGPGLFKYTPPTDYKSLCQDNLPDDVSGQNVSDFVWIKSRDTASAHMLFDSTRGRRLRIKSDSTSTETESTGTLEKFLSGGFAVGDQTAVNKDSDSTVAWMWHANGGTTTANTDGSGATIASTIQANQDAGFSIVKTVGTGNAGTIAHGLGKAPEWIIGKNLDTSGNWVVYHKSLGADQIIYLNLTAVPGSSSDHWGTTEPTSNVFGVKGGGVNVNTNTDNTIFYCWTSIEGYSKFGSYLGNAGSNGPLILTGFKPAWVMIKRITSTGEWFILDRARNNTNTGTKEYLDGDTTDSKGSLDAGAIDWLSNGFKLRQSSSQINNGAHVYMAFAEHPFLGDGTNPCTAV